MDAMTAKEFLESVRRNPSVAAALERLPTLGLSQCHLTAGCLFQTVWNLRSGRSAAADIRDLDVFTRDRLNVLRECLDLSAFLFIGRSDDQREK